VRKYLNSVRASLYWILGACIFLFILSVRKSLGIEKSACVDIGKSDTNIVLVLVAPWYLTNVPWYSFLLGLALIQRGRRVAFVVDDLITDIAKKNPKFQSFFIRLAARILARRINVATFLLSSLGDDYSVLSDDSVLQLITANWTHANQGHVDISNATKRMVFNNFRTIEKKLTTLNGRFSSSHCIVPGGILGSTGILYNVIRSAHSDNKIISYDSGVVKETIFSYRGVAALFEDIPFFLNCYGDALVQQRCQVLETARGLLLRRRLGKDRLQGYRLMNDKPKAAERFILISPNVAWDTAVLWGRCVFESHEEWILESTDYVLRTSPFHVKIRLHPAETFFRVPSMPKLKDRITRRFSTYGNRIEIIDPASSVDTYSLIEESEGVLTHNSTVGLEAMLIGKPVVVAAESYYSRSGVIKAPLSRADYFHFLSKVLTGEGVSHDVDAFRAALCYLLSQRYTYVFDEVITPSLTYRRWISRSFNGLLRSEYFDEINDGIELGFNPKYLKFLNSF
jgi:hypothetical protein